MLDLRKILVPVDFSERSAAVAPYAKAFATEFQSQLILLHVERPQSVVGTLFARTHRSGGVQEMSQVEAQLETLAKTEFQGLPVSQIVEEGDPAARIIECAGAQQADLIMMPTRGWSPYRRLFLGSITAKVLRDSDYPVWTSVHMENAIPSQLSCSKIACAVDLGPHTAPVLYWGAMLASRKGARLMILHATPPVDPFLEDASEPHPQVQAMQAAREDLERLLQDMSIKAEIIVGSGTVSEVVYRNVAQYSADLLVLGRHAAPGIAGRLHPHADKIIRESPCPVVTV